MTCFGGEGDGDFGLEMFKNSQISFELTFLSAPLEIFTIRIRRNIILSISSVETSSLPSVTKAAANLEEITDLSKGRSLIFFAALGTAGGFSLSAESLELLVSFLVAAMRKMFI